MRLSIPSSTSPARLLCWLFAFTLASGCQTRLAGQCTPVNDYIEHIEIAKVRDTLIARLDEAPGDNIEREQVARKYFEHVCPGLQTYPIPGSQHRSYACRVKGHSTGKPGNGAANLNVVGAHYDKSPAGAGVADNWTGVVMTTALLEYFSENQPSNTFEFVLFGEEEPGMKGSIAYLAAIDHSVIQSMINIDTLGLGPMTIDTRSENRLECLALGSARALSITTRSMALRQSIGDWKPFQRQGIPILNLHSLDETRLTMVHTWRDRRRSVDDRHVINAYRLILNTLLAIERGNTSRGKNNPATP